MGLLSSFSSRGRAMAAYKRAMQKANARDFEGAIAEYSTVVGMKKAPLDVRAMALFNRALAYSTLHDGKSARADLQTVISMPETPAKVRTAAKEKLVRMDKVDRRKTEDDGAH